eukprot:scaffold15851_cov146-Isochrysis_galbana.AAC.3
MGAGPSPPRERLDLARGPEMGLPLPVWPRSPSSSSSPSRPHGKSTPSQRPRQSRQWQRP